MRNGGILGVWVLALALAAGPAAAGPDGPWQPVGTLQAAPGEGLGPLTLSPDGALVAASLWHGGQSYSGAVWRSDDGRRVADLAGAFPLFAPFRFAGNELYSFDSTGLRVWPLAGGAPRLNVGFGPEVEANDVFYDARRGSFLVSQQMGSVLVYGRDGTAFARVETDPMLPHQEIAVTEGGDLLVVAAANFTLVYPMQSLPLDCPQPACPAAYEALLGGYGPYEELIAVDRARGWIATLPEVIPERAGWQDGVFRPVAAPTIRLWSQRVEWTSELSADRELTLASPVIWAEFSGDGRLLVAVEQSGRATLWAVASGALVQEFVAPAGDRLTGARFVPSAKWLYLNSASGAARLVRIGDGAPVQEIAAPNTGVVFTPDGRTMITSALADGPARIWRR